MKAIELAQLILSMTNEEQQLEVFQVSQNSCHHYEVTNVRVGFLNKYKQETHKGINVILLSIENSKYLDDDGINFLDSVLNKGIK